MPTTLGSIASRWRELQGSGSWEGLLDPLDPDLRASVIAYGELAEATYDAFNSQRRSPHAGSCIYGHADLLASAGVSRPGLYAVTKFFYATSGLLPPKIMLPRLLSATSVPDAFFVMPLPSLLEEPWCRESNWMGYVAVATDEGVAALGRRDIVVAWRGTVESLEWVNDLDFTPTSAAPVLGPTAEEDNGGAVVHHGFLSVYTSSDEDSKYNQASARDQVNVTHFASLLAEPYT
jgi:hypothetical protein